MPTMERSPGAVTSMPPPTPGDVSVFEEGGLFILRSQDGLALYRYEMDKDGRSHCTDVCNELWPPFTASADATAVVGQWKAIPRGTTRQWAYKGAPVYTYAKDTPGTQLGDGIGGVWRVITP